MFHSELSGKQQTGRSRSGNAEYLCLYFLTVFGLVLVGKLLLALSLLCFDLFFVIFSFKSAEVAMDCGDTYTGLPVGHRSKKLSQFQETWVSDHSAQKFLHSFRGHVQYFSFYSPSQVSTAALVTKNIRSHKFFGTRGQDWFQNILKPVSAFWSLSSNLYWVQESKFLYGETQRAPVKPIQGKRIPESSCRTMMNFESFLLCEPWRFCRIRTIT